MLLKSVGIVLGLGGFTSIVILHDLWTALAIFAMLWGHNITDRHIGE